MIRETIGQALDHDPDFRWRGQSVTRIENLSDIAFALALGMIIAASDVPRTFDDLKEFLFYLPPVAAAFAVMLQIWNVHFTFFRRYGVADQRIISLNTLLIFVVLFLAYPLRFSFDGFYAWCIGQVTQDYSRAYELGMINMNGAWTVSFFAFGFGVCMALLAFKYEHVIRRRSLLELSDYEFAQTRVTRLELWVATALSFIVVFLALYGPIGPMSAFLLFIQFPTKRFLNWSMLRRFPS